MTPKQAYERRRAERQQRREENDKRYGRKNVYDENHDEMADLFDRFVTAAERIADALEASRSTTEAGS